MPKGREDDIVKDLGNQISRAIKNYMNLYATTHPSWNQDRLVLYVVVSMMDFITTSNFTMFNPKRFIVAIAIVETFIASMATKEEYGKDMLSWLRAQKKHYKEYIHVSRDETVKSIKESVKAMRDTMEYVMHPVGKRFLYVLEKSIEKVYTMDKMNKQIGKLAKLLE